MNIDFKLRQVKENWIRETELQKPYELSMMKSGAD